MAEDTTNGGGTFEKVLRMCEGLTDEQMDELCDRLLAMLPPSEQAEVLARAADLADGAR